MYIVTFSDGHDVYKIDVAEKKYFKVDDEDNLFNKSGKKLMNDAYIRREEKKSNPSRDYRLNNKYDGNLKDLFGNRWAGGTYLKEPTYNLMKKFHENGMNIIMYTDDDLVDTSIPMTKKLMKIGKKKNSMAVFITGRSDSESVSNWNRFRDAMGHYKWITILEEN